MPICVNKTKQKTLRMGYNQLAGYKVKIQEPIIFQSTCGEKRTLKLKAKPSTIYISSQEWTTQTQSNRHVHNSWEQRHQTLNGNLEIHLWGSLKISTMRKRWIFRRTRHSQAKSKKQTATHVYDSLHLTLESQSRGDFVYGQSGLYSKTV